MAILYQYDSLADPVSPLYAERTSPDKYDSRIERPDSHKAAKITAIAFTALATTTALAFVNPVPAKERTTPDKWYPEIQRPRFDLKRQQSTSPTGATADRQQVPDLDSWVSTGQAVMIGRRWFAYSVSGPAPSSVPASQTAPALGGTTNVLVLSRSVPGGKITDPVRTTQQEFIGPDKWWTEASRRLVATPSVLYSRAYAGAVSSTFGERITPDKWHPEIQRPRFDLQRAQFDYLCFLRPDAQPVARLDSWVSETQRPLFDVRRQAYSYPSLAFSQFQFAESSAADRWHPEIQRPRFDLKRQQWLYPDNAVRPIATLFPERTTPDKWYPSFDDRVFDRQRRQAVFPFVGPGPVSTTFTETIFPDKWHPELTRPRFDLTRAQYEFSFFVEPDRQQVPDLDSWVPEPQKPLFDVRRLQALYPAISFSQISFAERTTADKWHPLVVPSQFDLKRVQWLYPSLSLTQIQFGEIVYADKWEPEIQRPRWDVARNQYLFPFYAALEQQPVARTDSWHPELGRPVFDVKRWQGTYPSLAFSQFQFAEAVTADRWHPELQRPRWDRIRAQYDDQMYVGPEEQPQPRVEAWHPELGRPRWDVKRLQGLYPWDAFVQFSFAERTTADKWYPTFVDRNFDKQRWQGLYPSLSLDVYPIPSPVFSDSWWQQPNSPVFLPLRSQWLNPWEAARPISTVFGERITVDKWFRETEKPQFDLKRQQFEALTFVEPDRQAVPLVVSWHPELQRPRWDVARRQWLYPSLQFSQFQFAESVYADKWHPELGRPRFDLVRAQFDGPSFVAPDKQPLARLDSWLPEVQRPLFDVRRQQYTYPALHFTQTQFGEIVRVSAWHPEMQRPRFDLKRTQALFPFEGTHPVAPTFTETVFVSSWHPELQRPRWDVSRRQAVYPFEAVKPVSTVFAERTSVDKWFQLAELVRAASNRNYVFQTTVDVQQQRQVLADAWYQQDQVLRRQADRRYVYQLLDALRVSENVTSDKWAGTLPERLGRAAFMPNQLLVVTAPAVVTPFDWNAQTEVPVSLHKQGVDSSTQIITNTTQFTHWFPVIPERSVRPSVVVMPEPGMEIERGPVTPTPLAWQEVYWPLRSRVPSIVPYLSWTIWPVPANKIFQFRKFDPYLAALRPLATVSTLGYRLDVLGESRLLGVREARFRKFDPAIVKNKKTRL